MAEDKYPHTPAVAETPDAWHTHGPHEKAQEAHGENVNTPMVLFFGTMAFLIIVVCVVATAIYFNWYATRLKIAREERFDLVEPNAAGVQSQYNAMRADVSYQFTEFGWADATTNTYRIPLEKAREKVLSSYAPAPVAK